MDADSPLVNFLKTAAGLHAREQTPQEAGMDRAKKYMRGMNSLAGGGSFGPSKTAGQYGAEAAEEEYTRARKATGQE